MISIIIVNWRAGDLLRRSLGRLASLLDKGVCEAWVVENCPGVNDAGGIEDEFPNTHLIVNSTNVGFAAANNQALHKVKGDYLLFLNPDTQIDPGSLLTLRALLDSRPDCAAVTCCLVDSEGVPQPSVRPFPRFWVLVMDELGLGRIGFLRHLSWRWPKHIPRQLTEVDQPMAALLLIRTKLLRDLGGFDESYFMYFDDVDLCLRLRKRGWKLLYYPHVRASHYGCASSGQNVERLRWSYESMFHYAFTHWGWLGASVLKLVSLMGITGRVALQTAMVVGAKLARRRDLSGSNPERTKLQQAFRAYLSLLYVSTPRNNITESRCGS